MHSGCRGGKTGRRSAARPRKYIGNRCRSRQFKAPLWALGLLALLGGFTFAGSAQVNPEQEGRPTVVPTIGSHGASHGDVKVPLIAQPLTLADFAGMEPRDDLRDKLGVVHRFIQNAPNNGKPATEEDRGLARSHEIRTLYRLSMP